jgi:hypothetical protein
VSDRALWLDEWCPTCRAAPDARCRVPWGRRATAKPSALHIARGWRARPCPKCKAIADEPCRTPPGRDASLAHEARLRPGLYELRARDDVSAELERRGATIATVPLAAAPAVDRIVLGRVRANELVDVERWSGQTSSATRWRRQSGIASDRSLDSRRSQASSCGPQPIGASSRR